MTKRLFIALLLLGVTAFGYSQTAEANQKPKNIVNKEETYNKLKELYIRMKNSKSQIMADSLVQLFFYKITPDMPLADITRENKDYLAWTKANLSKTEFKDVAEAEKLWAEYRAASRASVAENKEYNDYFFGLLRIDGGADIYTSVMVDVYQEYPDMRNRIKLPKRSKKSDFYPKLPSLPGN